MTVRSNSPMSETTTVDRPPAGIRFLHALGKEPDLASKLIQLAGKR